MPSVDSNSSYSSSDSSTSSLSSPRALLTDRRQQQQQQLPPPLRPSLPQQAIQQQQQAHYPMKTTSHHTSSLTPSHVCVTRYKTELCRPFTETGKCKYGDKCQFSHGVKELRVLMRHPKYKTEYCRTFHTTGYCPYGPRCHFIHDIHEARTNANSTDSTNRRHSDFRPNQSTSKSTNRNRLNSDYTILSPSSHANKSSNPSKYPFSFDELNELLLSYESGDVFQQQYPQLDQPQLQQQQQQQEQQLEFYPSTLPAMTNSLTPRTFSSSSSSNSSLAAQYLETRLY